MIKKILPIVTLLINIFVNAQNHDGIPVEGAKPITRNSFIQENQQISSLQRSNTTTSKSSKNSYKIAATPTGNSAEVGITAGELSVSLTGAALYTVPIDVPPGINNVEPNISLSYNSQQGNGIAGYGWSVRGISTISRVAATKYLDGTIDPVDLDNLDRFSLDGQRLVVKNGTTGIYGADGTIYETENYSNIKITSYGVGSNGGPAYFLVQYPDGSLAQYGTTTNSRSITDWSISFWENSQGVRINYNYTIIQNFQYISSITYGSIGSLTPINTVNFIYKDAAYPADDIKVAGFSISKSKTLNQIQIFGASNIGYKNYQLEYYSDYGLRYERLRYITEKNGDNSKSLNPTVFSYDTSPETMIYNGTANSNLPVSNINFKNSSNITGDFDGDGKMDFALYPTTGADAKKKFWLFNNIQGNTTNWGWDTPIGDFEELFPSSWLSWDKTLMPNQGITAIKKDTQIQGKVDFNTYTLLSYGIFLQYQKSVSFPLIDVEVCDDYSCQTTTQLTEIPKNYLSGDFNGDGLTDVIAIDKPVYTSSCYYDEQSGCFTSDYPINSSQAYFVDLDRFKTSNFMNDAGHLLSNYLSTDKLYVADVNGDGKSDILHFSGNSVKAYTLNDANQLVFIMSNEATTYNFSNNPIYLGDYNGDGKTDFLVPNGYGNVFIKFTSDGNVFKSANYVYPISYQRNDATFNYMIIPSDTNNDGKTDLTKVIFAKFSTYGSIRLINYRNDNGGWFTLSSSANTPDLPAIQAYPVPIFLTSDKSNMDLTIDFLSNNAIYNFKFNKDYGVDKLLKKITTGNGNEQSITYAPLKQKVCMPYCSGLPFYRDSGYTEKYPNYDIILAPTFQLVSNINTNGLQQDYGYYGAVTNLQGLGFLGFRGVAKTNFYNSNIPVLTTFSHYNPSLRGAITDEYTVLGTPYQLNYSPTDFISKTIYSYNTIDNINFTPFFTGSVFKLKNTITEKINGLDNTSILSTTVYDAFNNPKTITTTIKEGVNSKKTEVTALIYDDAPNATTDFHIGRLLNKKNTVTLLLMDTK